MIVYMRLYYLPVLFVLITTPLQSRSLRSVFQEESKNHKQAAYLIIRADTGKIFDYSNRQDTMIQRLPPGSVMKPLTAALLLKYDQNRVHKSVECKDPYYFNKEIIPDGESSLLYHDSFRNPYYYRCSRHNGHGIMNLSSAIIHSCNIFFLTATEDRPIFYFQKLITDWNIFHSTKSRIEHFHEKDTYGNSAPSTTDAHLALIGEGQLAGITLLKIAQVYSSIYRYGPMLSPYTRNHKTLAAYPSPITETMNREILTALRGVTRSGTLASLKIRNSAVQVDGGKTGSSTIHNRKYHTRGLNVILFRYRNAPYVMVTLVGSGNGSDTAARLSALLLENLP